MFVIYFMVLGIAAYGGNFIKISIAGISFTYITMAALGVSYFRYFVMKNGKLCFKKNKINNYFGNMWTVDGFMFFYRN